MFIQTEATPNPQTLKFIPGVEVLEDGTAQFNNDEDAKKSPLAEALFEIADVRGVFFGSDFVTVTKAEESEWNLIKPAILTTIMEHFVAARPLMYEDQGEGIKASSTINEDDSERFFD